MILLTGATGAVGYELARLFAANGVPAQAMVRSAAAAEKLKNLVGIAPVTGDFDDPAALDVALVGVERAFLLTNSTERAEAQQLAFVAARQEKNDDATRYDDWNVGGNSAAGADHDEQCTPTVDPELRQIWDKWIAMWNGDLTMADSIMASDYKLHMSPIGGEDLSIYAGLEGMAGWIGQLNAAFDPFVFEIQVQPLYGNGMIAGRWLASGTYKGGFPGLTAEPGTQIKFAGADFLRIENGKIAEYWLSANQLYLLKQLGMMG